MPFSAHTKTVIQVFLDRRGIGFEGINTIGFLINGLFSVGGKVNVLVVASHLESPADQIAVAIAGDGSIQRRPPNLMGECQNGYGDLQRGRGIGGDGRRA